MIKEFLSQQKEEYIGGFTAVYADPIMAHINPTGIHKKDIYIIIKSDKKIWATKVNQEGKEQKNNSWVEIVRDNVKRKTSPIMPKTYYFEIKKGDLFGTYVISSDFISNEHFCDSKSYHSVLIDNQ
jgi:hypothetical protein